MFKYTGYYLDDDIVPHRTFDCFMPEKVTQKTALFFVHGFQTPYFSRIY